MLWAELPIDITAEYVARFGEPEPGKKVFIRTQQQRDGWKDFPKDLSEVVPVRAGKGECGAERGVRNGGDMSSASGKRRFTGVKWVASVT